MSGGAYIFNGLNGQEKKASISAEKMFEVWREIKPPANRTKSVWTAGWTWARKAYEFLEDIQREEKRTETVGIVAWPWAMEVFQLLGALHCWQERSKEVSRRSWAMKVFNPQRVLHH
jgi:hypothetical protein